MTYWIRPKLIRKPNFPGSTLGKTMAPDLLALPTGRTPTVAYCGFLVCARKPRRAFELFVQGCRAYSLLTLFKLTQMASTNCNVAPPVRNIMFAEKWGERSWLVQYDGPYDNPRPRHVQLRADASKLGTPYDTMVAGAEYKLVELHQIAKNTIAWCVDDLVLNPWEKDPKKRERAHFTVHHGNRPLTDFK